jgi:hypothetical protein
MHDVIRKEPYNILYALHQWQKSVNLQISQIDPEYLKKKKKNS